MKIVNPYKFISRLLLLLLAVAALYVYLPREEALVELPKPMVTATVTVLNGDTLWDLAEEVSPENPREALYTIKQLNGLQHDVIYPGQTLVVPSESADKTAHE